jgi:hypothetical protein
LRKNNTRNGGGWFWPVACVVLAALVIILSYQNFQLRKQIYAQPEPFVKLDDVARLHPDDPAPPIAVHLPDGEEFIIQCDSLWAPLILAWYSQDCEPCLAALGGWNKLANMFPSQLWGIGKTSMDEFDTLFYGQKVIFPLVVPIHDTVFALYRIDFTPQTMVVLQDGTIGDVWLGPLDDRALAEIVEIMGQPFRKEVR